MLEAIMQLLKSAKGVEGIKAIKHIVYNAYHGEKTVLGDYVYISDRRFNQLMDMLDAKIASQRKFEDIIDALSAKIKELDGDIIEAFKDMIL